jgi:hypothetical protein
LYGNSLILITLITINNSRLRFSLPFFRLVQYQHQATIKGAGVIPDIYVGPDWRDVLHGVDTKMKTIEKIIEEGQK